MKSAISAIQIGERHRTEMGDIEGLARSIEALGLLQPIGITHDNVLIFGERRLRACRDILGWTEIETRVLDMPRIVVGENAENEVRKDFTPSERVAIAQAIASEFEERRGRPSAENPQKFAEIARGQETRDFAAKKAGFGNRETFRQAEHVVQHAEPELVEAMDRNVVSISAAHRASKLPAERQREIAKTGRTFADLQRDLHRRHREKFEDLDDQSKVQRLCNAVMDIAYSQMSADEFRRLAPRPTLERLQQVALPAFIFLRDMVEVADDQTRAG